MPRQTGMTLRNLAISLLLATAACAAPDEPPAAVACPAPEVAPTPEPVAAIDAGDAEPPPRSSVTVLLDTHLASLQVESAALRAAQAWEERTLGRVHFRAITTAEAHGIDCTTPYVAVYDGADWLAEGATIEGVGAHVVTRDECHAVAIEAAWADPSDYQLAWSKFGIDPLVVVAAHELGHALGLGHASLTVHTIMTPDILLTPSSSPTCVDVASLGLLWGSPLPCAE